MENEFESKDKQIVPFLLTLPDIKFEGTRATESIIYFRFTPFILCQRLVNDFACRKAPLVQPKDLLDAVETFRDMVFEMKEKRRNDGQFQ